IAGLAAQLGASVIETARGIVSVVQTNMLGAIRVVSVRKGYDPRGYTLVAFDGAGPLRRRALVPRPHPGPRSRHRARPGPAGPRPPLRAGVAGGAAAPRSGPHARGVARHPDG